MENENPREEEDQEEAENQLPTSIGDQHSGKRGQRYAVFVQWERGKAPQYAEEVVSSGSQLALSQARNTIERRWDPVSIWVVARDAITKSKPGEKSLSPDTDRSYRETAWYAQNLPEIPDDQQEVFGDD